MIDDKAIISKSAEIGNNVSIGAYSIIGENVSIGDDSQIGPHVVITKNTKLGKANRIYQFASIGEDPQDKKFSIGDQSELEIGDGNVIREYCSINRGTKQGGGKTIIGNDNWIMAYAHIAHDCIVGNSTVFSNNATLGGHVTIGDYVILGGFTAVHQFCNIGRYCFTGGFARIVMDIPPFLMVACSEIATEHSKSSGNARVNGLNREGLKRHGFDIEMIDMLRKLYKIVYRDGLNKEKTLDALKPFSSQSKIALEFSNFIENSTRGIMR